LWRGPGGTFFDGVIGFKPGEPRPPGTLSVPVGSLLGQTGCACFDRQMNVVALHYGPDPTRRNASLVMPIRNIITSLLDAGFRSLLYEDYAI
jgi:hypothetical protein